MSADTPITTLHGVGHSTALALERLHIRSVEDLLYYSPSRYERFKRSRVIAELQPGNISFVATIEAISSGYRRKGRHITTATAVDPSGQVSIVWFNQPYRKNQIRADVEYFISGDLRFDGRRYSLTNPSIEEARSATTENDQIIAIYPETKGVTSKLLRKLVARALPYREQLPPALPTDVEKSAALPTHKDSLRMLHRPTSLKEADAARRYFELFELFGLMLGKKFSRRVHERLQAPPIPFDETATKKFVSDLPFTLTNAQRRCAWRILQDLEKDTPMNRLLQGDVGAGKTVVAAIAILGTLQHGLQVAFMAPTEILAEQHFKTLTSTLSSSTDQLFLLTGSTTSKDRAKIRKLLQKGSAITVVGTHALLSEAESFSKLGFVVIDEQHRFGVSQRQKLQNTASGMPHLLCMSATPIPRSLALTIYGELRISTLDELPSNRKAVTTHVVPPNSTASMQARIFTELESGRQGFVVYPLIESSETLTHKDVITAYKDALKSKMASWRLGLLHGKMKSKEKADVISRMQNHDIDILFTTPVIEVGVDIPNASFMIVHSAERFGLAQLHQLRGRVGRGEHQAVCFMVPTTSSNISHRLKSLTTVSDGFKLAQIDLEMRGPGAIYGTLQHGALDIDLGLLANKQVLELAQNLAQQFVETEEELLQYPRLAELASKARSITKLN